MLQVQPDGMLPIYNARIWTNAFILTILIKHKIVLCIQKTSLFRVYLTATIIPLSLSDN